LCCCYLIARPMLELKDVIVKRRALLFQVPNLQLVPGNFVALIGANGSGKSTLLKFLTGDLRLLGSAHWSSQDLAAMTSEDRAKLIAKVDNSFPGLDHMSTREYLSLGRFPYTGAFGFLSDQDIRVVEDCAQDFHLTHLLDQPTSHLSDGERQRASIARAMIQETPIILLDEPTSFLDYPGKRRVMEILRDVAQKMHKVVVMATHDLDLSLDYCTSWMVIESENHVLTHLVKTPTKESIVTLAFPRLEI